MPSNHLILSHPLLLLLSIFPSIGVFSNESALHIRWPKYWSFSFSISPSNGYTGLISFRMDWFDLLAVPKTQGTTPSFHKSQVQTWPCISWTLTLTPHPSPRLSPALLPPKEEASRLLPSPRSPASVFLSEQWSPSSERQGVQETGWQPNGTFCQLADMPGIPIHLTQPDHGSTFIIENRGPLGGPPLPPGPPLLVGVMVLGQQGGSKRATTNWCQSYMWAIRDAWGNVSSSCKRALSWWLTLKKIMFNWRIIASEYCVSFCHSSTWIHIAHSWFEVKLS